MFIAICSVGTKKENFAFWPLCGTMVQHKKGQYSFISHFRPLSFLKYNFRNEEFSSEFLHEKNWTRKLKSYFRYKDTICILSNKKHKT